MNFPTVFGIRKLGTSSLAPHYRHENDKERWPSPPSHPSLGHPLGRRSLFKVVITFGRCFWYSGALFRELLSSQFKLRRGATVFAGGPSRPPPPLLTPQPSFLFLLESFRSPFSSLSLAYLNLPCIFILKESCESRDGELR